MNDIVKRVLQALESIRRCGTNTTTCGGLTGFPETYCTTTSVPGGATATRPQVFEPALKHYARAFRLGDPLFADTDYAARWSSCRRLATDHVLRLVIGSPFADHLVLRGSVLLREWFGDAAREPGDLDFVVRPPSIKPDDDWTRELFNSFARLAAKTSSIGDVTLHVDRIAFDEIWTYDRAPGRRFVLPWTAAGLPTGTVQVDIVFGEAVPAEPERLTIQTSFGNTVAWAAGKELSLAWKLQWLATDMYPQGKDLYDAVLLAESTPLSFELLRRLLEHGDDAHALGRLGTGFLLDLPVDWDNFTREYPWVHGTVQDWNRRLQEALRPTFDVADQ